MKKNLLLGNGINIQMGGLAYSSKFILDRVKFRAKLEGYSELFGDILTPDEIVGVLNGFVQIANDVRNNVYDTIVSDEELVEAVRDFKNRYTKEICQPHDIMLEDWFLLINVFFEKNDDLVKSKKDAIVGFERLLLDAIYNDGLLNDLHKSIVNKKVCKFFCSYDDIFTLNYDENIEKLTGKIVYHLHGDFSVLADSENDKCINGYLRRKQGQLVYQEIYKHCYCNALLNYSGNLKYKKAKELDMARHMGEQLIQECERSPEELEKYRTIMINDISAYDFLKTKIENPHLEFASNYHFEEFIELSGEIDIIGMSPNNDEHILNMIFNNNKIEKIVFYYYSDWEKNYIIKHYLDKRIECKDVSILWKGLNWKKATYNYKFEIPSQLNIVEICKAFSEYEASEDEILKDASRIDKNEIDRLCELVHADIEKRNPEHKSTDEHDFNMQRFSISYIALREGILPPALFLLYIKYGVRTER